MELSLPNHLPVQNRKSRMKPTNLHSLPTELLLLVLQSLSSPRDLSSLISASSSCYRTFISYRCLVFSSILQNAIHPAAQADALMALEAQQITWLFGQGCSFDFVYRHALRLLRNFPSPDPNRSFLKIIKYDRRRLKKLFRFYSVVERFMSCYAHRALGQLGSFPTSTTPRTLPSTLSSTEVGRLQRAFFRFETYAQFFRVLLQPKFRMAGEHILLRTEPALAFLSRLSSWEIEEIACVAQCIATLVGEIFDEVEDDFVRAVEAAIASRSSQKAMNTQNTWGVDGGVLLLHCRYPPFFRLNTKKFRHNNYLSFVVSRGLVHVKGLLQLECNLLRKAVVGSYFDGWEPLPDLQLALFCSRSVKRVTRNDRDAAKLCADNNYEVRASYDADDPFLQKCNTGWLWAFGYDLTVININAPVNTGLRESGYVFWDRARLERSGLLSSARSVSWKDPYGFSYADQNRCRLPSVEERLRPLECQEITQTVAKDLGLTFSQPWSILLKSAPI
jgi:hypothetical protein